VLFRVSGSLGNGVVTIELPVTASAGISARLYGTASYALTASYAENSSGGISSVYTTGSITGSGLITNPVALTDPLVINTITSSFIYAPQITGSLFGTSSYSLTASYAQNSLSTVFTSGNITGSGTAIDTIRLKDNISLTSVSASFNGNLIGTASFATTASYALNSSVASASIQNAYNRLRYQATGNFDITGSATVMLPNSSLGSNAFPVSSFDYIDVSVTVKQNNRWVNDLLSVHMYTSSTNVYIELSAPAFTNTDQYKILAVNENSLDYLVI
jgi:hypothetical protein